MVENIQNIDEDEEIEGPNKEERVLGAISYAPFGFIVPLLMHKDSEFLSLHVKQGGIIFGIYFVLNIIPIPFIFGILSLIYIGIAIYGSIQAYNGEMYEFSFVKKLIDKLNGK